MKQVILMRLRHVQCQTPRLSVVLLPPVERRVHRLAHIQLAITRVEHRIYHSFITLNIKLTPRFGRWDSVMELCL